MSKVIDDVIAYAKNLKNKGFKLDYQTETVSGLVQVYLDMERYGIVVVSGPPIIVAKIMAVLENN